jgi:GNAT superfamily N-acetyltransferase
MSLIIRLAADAEVETVHRVMRAAFAGTARYAHPSSALRESVEDVRAAIVGGGAVLVRIDGEAVATARFTRPDADTLRYARLGVLPGWRGRGLGAQIDAWLADLARAEGRTAIEASARSQMPDNRPFYRRLGYAVVGAEAVYGVPDLRTWMRRSLEPRP